MSKRIDPEQIERVGGWRVKTSNRVYDNRWISVFHQEVVTPGGTDGIYGLVHFKGVAVGVVPLDEDGNTWLVKQSRYTLNKHTWEIPEGGASSDEDPEDCAHRELEEEVGLKANKLSFLMELHTSNSVTDEVAYVYLAQDLYPGQQKLDASEDIQVMKLPLQSAVDMAMRGEITDSISVAALLRVAMNTKE